MAETKAVEIKKAIGTERIKMKVIVDLPDFAERAAESGVEYIGLTRLEGIIASTKKHPLQYEKENKLEDYTKLLEQGITKIIEHFRGIWVRASDIRTDEYGSLEGAPEREINPMLGFHGVRFSLKHPSILNAELQAIKNVAKLNPEKKIGIMFPQIISIEEVREAKKYFNEFKTENMEFGVMIETPAAVQIIEEICDEVDFISFGTNDLTQFTLAVDRNNEDVQYLYNELHPSIYSQIKKVIRECRRKNVETSICGQAGSKKEMVEFLFRKGIDSISVNADAAFEISSFINQIEKEWKMKKEVFEKEKRREQENEKKRKDEELIRRREEEMKKREELIMKKEEEIRKDQDEIAKRRLQIEHSTHPHKGTVFDEKIELKRQKLREKRRRKKERNRIENWDKKARIGIMGERLEERNEDYKRKDDSYLSEQKNEYSRANQIPKENKQNKFLDRDKIKISAERKNADGWYNWEKTSHVKPIDNLNRIEKQAEYVEDLIEHENREQIRKNEEIEDKIKTEVKRVDEMIENEKDETRESEIEKLEYYKEKRKEEDEVDKAVDSMEEEKEIEDILLKTKDFDEDFEKQELDEYDKNNRLKESEENLNSEDNVFENIGVYNPDDNGEEEKTKFKYNFDD